MKENEKHNQNSYINHYLIHAFKKLGKNQQDVILDLGNSQPYVSALMNGKKKVGKDVAKKLKDLYGFDELATLTGNIPNSEGSMLKEEEVSLEEGKEVLLLPISAQGGSLGDFSVQVRAEDCERIISPIKDVDFAMTVTGDSMFPEYPSGAKIFVKKINEKSFIDWGRVYVLDTINGSVIKKIMPGEDSSKIKCVSINEEYPPFEIALSDIHGFYRVLLCMSLK